MNTHVITEFTKPYWLCLYAHAIEMFALILSKIGVDSLLYKEKQCILKQVYNLSSLLLKEKPCIHKKAYNLPSLLYKGKICKKVDYITNGCHLQKVFTNCSLSGLHNKFL